MSIFKNIINNKINKISGAELLSYAKQFDVGISMEEAEKIARILRGKKYDIFDDGTRAKVLKQIEQITGPEKTREINKIFSELTK